MVRRSGSGLLELAVVVLVGVLGLAAAVLLAPAPAQDATVPPRSSLYRGPDADRRPLDRLVLFEGVPAGWSEDVASRDFLGLGGQTNTLTALFTDDTGATGDDARAPVFVCLTYADGDTCTLAGPDLIASRRVGRGVLMKISELTGEDADGSTPTPMTDAERRQWRGQLSVRFPSARPVG